MLTRLPLLALCLSLCLATGCKPHQDSLGTETQRIEAWRQQRATSLTSENGWLTLAGLYWLKPGNNRFGRDSHNDLVLNHPAVPDTAGVFDVQKTVVSFTAEPNSGVMLQGQPVTQINLATDAAEKPTILTLGSLRFYAIERAGQFGVRVRDTEHPARKAFKGLEYFAISTAWRIDARYEAYLPSKRVAIVNILGMTEQMESPGALVFDKDGRTWRLDTILESPTIPSYS